MYLLGVDGGGTKLEFMVTDREMSELFRFQYDCNSNLKYSGANELIDMLRHGFDQIKQIIDFTEIDFAYFGIAECGEKCDITGRQQVLEYIQTELPKFQLGDDQYSVFRSKTTSKYGVLANAGTGSNINYFQTNSEQTFKSLGVGGRDLGRIIIDLIVADQIHCESEIYKHVRWFLGESPMAFYDSLNQMELIKNYQISQIPKILVEKSADNSKLRKEMEFYAVFVASRWITKINGKCVNNFRMETNTQFDLAMSGSLWKWISMREKVIIGISKLYPNVNFCYDSEKKPVEGCILIASEMMA